LDLIFTSELIVQNDVKIIALISNCDHNVLLCNNNSSGRSAILLLALENC